MEYYNSLIFTLKGHKDRVHTLNELYGYLVSGSFDKVIKILNVASGSPFDTINFNLGEVYFIKVTKQGYLLIGSSSGKLRIIVDIPGGDFFFVLPKIPLIFYALFRGQVTTN